MSGNDTFLNSNFLQPIEESEKAYIPQNIKQVGAEIKWSKGITGSNVIVAILDSGIDLSHDRLKKAVIGGYNFSEEGKNNFTATEDYNGHGTHKAGIILSIAPNVKLLNFKILNKNGLGTVKSLVDAINFAIDWKGNNDEKIRVISLSVGLKKPDEELHRAIKRAINSDIAVVVSVGNDGDGNMTTEEVSYPAFYKEVIGVGAITGSSNVATFSNTNKEVDIYAPGVNIYSTYLNGKFARLSGTSMAAPHVTGALALLIEEYESICKRQITEAQLYKLLNKNTKSKQFLETDISTLLLTNEIIECY